VCSLGQQSHPDVILPDTLFFRAQYLRFSEKFARVASCVHFVRIKTALKCCYLMDQKFQMASDTFCIDRWLNVFGVL
jgi:hypothetical protein